MLSNRIEKKILKDEKLRKQEKRKELSYVEANRLAEKFRLKKDPYYLTIHQKLSLKTYIRELLKPDSTLMTIAAKIWLSFNRRTEYENGL